MKFASLAVAVSLSSALVSGCRGGKPDCSGDLMINEVMVATDDQVALGAAKGSPVELYNASACPINLGDYRIAMGDQSIEPQVGEVGPKSFVLISEFADRSRNIAIIRKSDGAIVDELSFPVSRNAGETYGRYPDGSANFILYSPKLASIGDRNKNPGFIRKLADSTNFRPRDSSVNAMLSFEGSYYIFSGWSNFLHDVWYSYTDTWISQDGVSWDRISLNPPYSRYSSFVVFKSRMWAFAANTFSSSDGVSWRPEEIKWGDTHRVVVFKDSLYGVIGSVVQRSTDGVSWETLTSNAPWGAGRTEPALVVFRDRLWLFGGATWLNGQIINYDNDVWVSDNGADWTLVTANAPWEPRRWMSSMVHDDKIFVINGHNPELWPNDFGNVADIWFSNDGMTWQKLASEYLWESRHASFLTQGHDGEMILSAGYGHGGVERIHNDVWSIRLKMYFPKPTGDLADPLTWGRNIDGSGDSPEYLHDAESYFVLRNRNYFAIDNGLGLVNLIVGDGVEAVDVELDTDLELPETLYVNARASVNYCGDPDAISGAIRYLDVESEVRCP